MSTQFSKLEQNILKSKGLSEEQLTALAESGITKKADFDIVGDAATLADVSGLSIETAQKVMEWALGSRAPTTENTASVAALAAPIIIDSADVVHCKNCSAKQPKDYSPGDLCPSCGLQAEPVCTCYWCSNSGPGNFCRSCGAKFVAFSDLELAIQLRREGHSKDEIAPKLAQMGTSEKQTLWARAKARN